MMLIISMLYFTDYTGVAAMLLTLILMLIFLPTLRLRLPLRFRFSRCHFRFDTAVTRYFAD